MSFLSRRQGAAAPADAVLQRPAKMAKAARAAALDAEAEEAGISLQEVFRRLRALEQPVTLFGEVRLGRSCCLWGLDVSSGTPVLVVKDYPAAVKNHPA